MGEKYITDITRLDNDKVRVTIIIQSFNCKIKKITLDTIARFIKCSFLQREKNNGCDCTYYDEKGNQITSKIGEVVTKVAIIGEDGEFVACTTEELIKAYAESHVKDAAEDDEKRYVFRTSFDPETIGKRSFDASSPTIEEQQVLEVMQKKIGDFYVVFPDKDKHHQVNMGVSEFLEKCASYREKYTPWIDKIKVSFLGTEKKNEQPTNPIQYKPQLGDR